MTNSIPTEKSAAEALDEKFHRCWTNSNGPGYDKKEWRDLEAAIANLMAENTALKNQVNKTPTGSIPESLTQAPGILVRGFLPHNYLLLHIAPGNPSDPPTREIFLTQSGIKISERPDGVVIDYTVYQESIDDILEQLNK